MSMSIPVFVALSTMVRAFRSVFAVLVVENTFHRTTKTRARGRTTMNRRGFFGMLLAAPLAAYAAVQVKPHTTTIRARPDKPVFSDRLQVPRAVFYQWKPGVSFKDFKATWSPEDGYREWRNGEEIDSA